jgi:prefoldin subunit 5
MVEPDDVVLEELRAIRGEISKLAGEMQTLSVEMTAMRQLLAGVENRLELAD